MDRIMRFLCSALLAMIVSVPAWSQAQVYTRKAKLADLPTKITKVVLSGESPVELALKTEVASCWRISSYEFCSPEEYEKLNKNSNFYFLRLANEDGILFLIFNKGGEDNKNSNLNKPLEIVRIPVSTEGQFSGREVVFFGAWLGIIQSFTEKAMASDRIAYTGLGAWNLTPMNGKRVYLDEDRALEAFTNAERDSVIPVFIVSADGHTIYKMMISCDTHEILYFAKVKVKSGKEASFNAAELKVIEKRNAELVR